MKDKTLGWGSQSPRINYANGDSVFNTHETHLWNTIFMSHLALRPNCYTCRYTNMHRPGDLTIGDYWGIQNVHPEFYDKKGVSLLLINSSKGSVIFENLKDHFHYLQTDEEKCFQYNLYHQTECPTEREQFWKDYIRLSFRQVCVKYFNYGFRNKITRKFYNLINRITNKK